MDNALEADDGEQSAGNGGGSNGAQDDQTEQATGVAARLSLEEEVGTARGRDVGGHGGGGGEEGGLAGGGRWHWRVQQQGTDGGRGSCTEHDTFAELSALA